MTKKPKKKRGRPVVYDLTKLSQSQGYFWGFGKKYVFE